MTSFFKSSIGQKFGMALSAIFLMIFLIQHFTINITSIFSPELFNYLSHFMGTNPMVQFILQPLLISGVIFHFTMGFYLEYQNRKARKYIYNKSEPSENSTWFSRNMLLSGLVILAFLILHFIDFWFPEINHKYIQFLPENSNRYYSELIEKFKNPFRVTAYCISFILLSMHLLHGFNSSIKSIGVDKYYIKSIKKLSLLYSIGIPFGFCLIALFHHLKHYKI